MSDIRRTGVAQGLLGLALVLGAMRAGRSLAQDADETARPEDPAADAPPVEVVTYWFPKETADNLPARAPGWLPVYVELRTSRDRPQFVDIEGTVTSTAGEEYRNRTRVEVYPGASRKFWTYLRFEGRSDVSGSVALTARVRLLIGETAFREDSWTFQLLTDASLNSAIPILVSGEGVNHLNWECPWSKQRFGNTTPNIPAHALVKGNRVLSYGNKEFGVAENCLPDDPLGYHQIGVLILRNPDETEMEKEQVEAIRDWVYLGGFVVLVPSTKGEIFSGRLARLLFPEGAIGDVRADENFEPRELLESVGGQFSTDLVTRLQDRQKNRPPSGKYLRIDPIDPIGAPADREIRSFDLRGIRAFDQLDPEKGVRVYHERRFGAGRVGVLTIDDQLHADDPGDPYRDFRQDLWYRILDSSSGGASDRWRRRVAQFQDRSVFNFMKSGLSRDLGIWFIAGLVLVYLLLVGPGLYFFLKRKGKLQWVVWIEPGIVVVYVGMIFLTGYLTKGVLTQARTVTLFQWQLGDPVMEKHAYLGILSSDESRYRISAPGARWLRPALSNREEATGMQFADTRGMTGEREPAIHNFRLDIWQTAVVAAMDLIPASGGIGIEELQDTSLPTGVEDPAEEDPAEVEDPPGGAAATGSAKRYRVRNRSSFTIRQAFLVDGRHNLYPAPGAIDSGGEVEIALSPSNRYRREQFKAGDGAVADAEGEREAPLADDTMTRDTIYRLLEGGSNLRTGRTVVFVGVLDRSEDDFVVDRGAMIMHRADLLVVYR